MPKDFNTAMRQAGLGEYASKQSRPYTPTHSRKTTSKTTNNPMKQAATYQPVQTTPTSIWPEYTGISQHNHGGYVYSESEHRARLAAMKSLISHCENILLRNYRGIE